MPTDQSTPGGSHQTRYYHAASEGRGTKPTRVRGQGGGPDRLTLEDWSSSDGRHSLDAVAPSNHRPAASLGKTRSWRTRLSARGRLRQVSRVDHELRDLFPQPRGLGKIVQLAGVLIGAVDGELIAIERRQAPSFGQHRELVRGVRVDLIGGGASTTHLDQPIRHNAVMLTARRAISREEIDVSVFRGVSANDGDRCSSDRMENNHPSRSVDGQTEAGEFGAHLCFTFVRKVGGGT